MPFGYVPNKKLWKNLILKMAGHPNLIRRIQAPVIMRMLQPQRENVILDVGCGRGFFTYEIGKSCKKSIGIDLNINKGSSFAINKLPKVAYVRGDAQKLPFVSVKFDKILLSSVLQMVKDDEALLKECHRVLKAKGLLILSVPIGYCYLKKLNKLKGELKKRFGALGNGYYEQNKVIELLRNEGFEIMEKEYSPKKMGSLIFEIGLFFWYHFYFPFFTPLLFPVLYPIVYFDKFANSKQAGNELVIKARKTSK